jgi:hypothetical protein
LHSIVFLFALQFANIIIDTYGFVAITYDFVVCECVFACD